MRTWKWMVISALLAIASYAQEDNKLTTEEVSAGWKLLFDGTDSSMTLNWVDYAEGKENNTDFNSNWVVNSNGNFELLTKITTDLRTTKKYGDFVWYLDFKIKPFGTKQVVNEGLFYRSTLCGKLQSRNAIEYAINANIANRKQYTGAAYDLYANSVVDAEPYIENPNEGWNTAIIIAIGDSVEQYLNGVKTVGFKYWSPEFLPLQLASKFNAYPMFCLECDADGNFEEDTYVQSGYLGIQGNHGGLWEIKNMKVLENPIIGCMDPTREFYNPNATYDIHALKPGDEIDSKCGDIVGINAAQINVKSFRHSQKDNNLTIRFENSDNNIISIFDLLGNKVASKSGVSDVFTFSNLKEGVYFVKVENELEMYQVQRINIL